MKRLLEKNAIAPSGSRCTAGPSAVDAVGSVLANVAPAFQQEVFIDEAVEVEEPIVLSVFGLVGYCALTPELTGAPGPSRIRDILDARPVQ